MARSAKNYSTIRDEEEPVEVELQGIDSDLLSFSVTTSKRKDISREARSKKDIKRFASSSDSTILLQCLGENEGQILIYATDELIRQGKIPEASRKTFMDAMLTDENIPKFKNVVQGKEAGSWMVPVGEIPELTDRIIAFVRLKSPVNFGGQAGVAQLLFFVFTPLGVAPLKGPFETGKTFASILQDPELRFSLTSEPRREDIQQELMRYLCRVQPSKSNSDDLHLSSALPLGLEDTLIKTEPVTDGLDFYKVPFSGIVADIKRRIPWYPSDYLDGVNGLRTIGKSLSTIAFLYFACILPAIAFGVLNEDQTEGHIDVKKMIWSQALGGAAFAIFSGQPLVVLLSTAPLALYMKVIFAIAGTSGMDFYALYGWVGVSNGVFLALYAITNASGLLKYVSRFTEETFGVFISIAFAYDAIRPMVENYIQYYYDCDDSGDQYSGSGECNREESLQFLILLAGTVLFGWWFWSLKSSTLLTRTLREKISDYSLPLAVGVMTILGSGILRPTNDEPFPYEPQPSFILVPMLDVPIWGAGAGIGLGFILSVLYFMDQNISSKMVNTPNHHLRKGPAYHMDLLVMAMITVGLSLAGLPWIHGALPHSPLHVRALADLESVYLPGGTVEERVVRVRESRVPVLIAHILIGLSVFMVPTPLQEIPVPVLYGVFLYLSVTALPGNQFWQRILLFITDRNRYPPNHVVRHAPSRVIHAFTLVQILCLLWLCVFGFTPVDYIQMLLPLAIIVLIPVRKFVIGYLFSSHNLDALDGE